MLTYADNWQAESVDIAAAREKGAQLGDKTPSATAAATLAVLTAAVSAQAAVEVGTGVGVTGLRILEGLADDGVLTTIDADANHQSAAKEAFAAAGVSASRARLINGEPSEVLPRLADQAYDLVVINNSGSDPQSYLEQALRLLRSGGVVVFGAALGPDGAVADPARREPSVVAQRELAQAIKDDESLVSALIPISDGLLIAVRK